MLDTVLPPIRVRLLGNVEIDGVPGGARLITQPKLLLVFAYLLIARPRGFQRRDRLVALFWPEQTDDKARASLRNALHSLRDILGAEAVIRRGDVDVGIERSVVWCDAVELEEAIAGGLLARALELYRGRLLDGVFGDSAPLDSWIEDERDHYRVSAADAAWSLAERYESDTDLTHASRWARKAAKLATSDERRIRKIMGLLDRAGDRAGAIGVYDAFARFLESELELVPSSETRALADAIRRRA